MAKAMGTQISLVHRSGTPVTLDAEILSESVGGMKQPGTEVEAGMLIAAIPVQTGFVVQTGTTRPITVGDRIEYPLSSERYYWVEDDADIRMLDNGYVYEVTARERKTLTAGVLS
jgi:hypothetical protein